MRMTGIAQGKDGATVMPSKFGLNCFGNVSLVMTLKLKMWLVPLPEAF